MRLFRHGLAISVLAVCCALLPPQSARGQTKSYSKSAPSGKSHKIDSYSGWNNDCSFRTINVDIVEAPVHGQVSPRIVNSKITNSAIGSSGKCRGKPTRAVAVYYKSKSGYRGSDRFKVRMSVGGGAPAFFVYQVNVR